MKFNFGSSKSAKLTPQNPAPVDRLAAFKAKADSVLAEDTINKITGGRLSDCHCHCHRAASMTM